MSAEGELVERETLPAVQQANATTLLTAIAAAASNPAADIDKMERLFAMHEQMVKREAEMAFNAAFSRAQARMVPVVARSTNEQTHSKYAKLAAINKEITPIYTEEGFSVSFNNGDSPTPGFVRILGTLSHPSGHSRHYQIDMPPDDVGIKGTVNKTKLHAAGSTNSYGRRYLICQMWNVTTEDDTDGVTRKNAMPEGAVKDWLAAIDACADAAATETLWPDITKSTASYGDVAAHEELRAALLAKRKALKSAPKKEEGVL